ncbi:conserved Plasmodium protein, unknown function [Plasmodium sp. gorilla clade G2]|uniref:conserved Plasmodium protein, unknown function n=1 Tax=Plasmodium sp. gorilla clade G2 TaxID=880535 RepID=UPI000D20926F|nr:conserved Plasmodium protein, unknown function [Plasmodium sp. gorilla clade G2]SOV17930.1 conserved Plasmodium protein, unknown function [Plasmodium sp. gorilla clade G2]
MRSKDKSITCSYCANIIEEKFTYINNLWKTYEMCISCKDNLKCCICCEKKIINKDISSLTSCCGSSREKLCEDCRSIPLICCNKNIVNIIGDILYFLDSYLHINISKEFITFQNIYTFNKIQYNEKNHIYSFQLNHMKYNKMEKATYIMLNHKDKKMENRKYNINNLKKKKENTEFYSMHINDESQIKDNITISLKKKGQKIQGIEKINKLDNINSNNIITNNDQRKYFSSFFHSFKSLYTKKRNNMYISKKDEDLLKPSINIIQEDKNNIPQNHNIYNIDNIQEIYLLNNNITNNNHSNHDTLNNNIPIRNASRISRFYTNTSTAFFDYIKKIRKQQQSNKKKKERKNKKGKFIFYENILLSIYEKKKEQKLKDNEKNNLQNKRNMDKYKFNLVLYFMDKQDFNGVYKRLLENELKYCDIIYLNYILKKKCINKYGNDKWNDYIYNSDIYNNDIYNNNNTYSNNTYNNNTYSYNTYNNDIYDFNSFDRCVSSCGCVTVSAKKLFKLHQQNKRIHNYKYKNINLKYLNISNENIKLIDNVSLNSAIPKISFYFYLAHELMHAYIWLTKIERSKNYKHIYMIVHKLYNNYFEVTNEMHYNDYHKNSSFYISSELEEALCIYVSIKFIKYMEKDPYYNIQKSLYEKELIQYYIKKYEQSTSPMYGSNYRLLKKILKNYQLIHILHIINDIYFSKFYPIVTLNLLQAVISFIDFKNMKL